MESTPSVVFREPQILEQPDPKEVAKERSGASLPTLGEFKPAVKTPPLSIYQGVKGRPYSADYFDLGNTWEHWNFPKELESIENFIKGEIKDYNLTDSVESYKEVINKLESKIGKRENEKVWSKLDRLVSYIKAIDNTRRWELRKKQLEEAISG